MVSGAYMADTERGLIQYFRWFRVRVLPDVYRFLPKGDSAWANAMMLDTNHCLAQLMADTDAALQGRQSYPPSLVSLHSNQQRSIRPRRY